MNSDRAEMNDIIDYLNARADEDERAARAAGASHPGWSYDPATFTVSCDAYPIASHRDGSPLTDVDGAHIARHDPARVLADVEVVRQVISDYRASDGAILRGNPDIDDPGWRGIYAGRDAFKSVLRAYAKAAGWKASTTE